MKIKLLATLLLFLFANITFAAQAKDFELATDDGSISLANLKGQVVYVDFWASWCTPCRKSFPWMNKMHAKYKSQGLTIIGISLDSTRKGAKKFLKKVPALFSIAYDHEGHMADEYNVQVMPTSYLIDRQGNLIMTHKGFRSKHEKALEEEFIKALATP